MKLYLAHPVDSRGSVRLWELDFEFRSGIILVNPFYDIPKPHKPNATREELYEIASEISVERDIETIENSDGLVAIIDNNLSYGVPQEMIYARLVNKSVYSLITNGQEKHPWLRYHSTKIFTSYKELEEFLLNETSK